MPVPFLLIDGYNLMHAAGLARGRYGPGDLERCRHRLLMFLVRRLEPEERERGTVVFDAHAAPPGVPRTSSMHGLRIVFAPPGEDADSLIEQLLAKHSAPRQVVVVSSDHRLQKAARRRQAESVGSDEFHELLTARPENALLPAASPSSPQPNPQRESPADAEETEFWLQEFGEPSRQEITPEKLPNELEELQRVLDEHRDLDEWLDGKTER